jgi:hypothetical protein
MNRDLYVVVSAGSGDPLWSAVTTADEAEEVAVRVAVNHGNCNLLNGADLADHLSKRAA